MNRSAPLVSLAVALVAARALAQAPHVSPPRAPPVQLAYTLGPGAGSCPGTDGLRQAVVDDLGYDPFQPVAPLRLSVHIERRGGELVVETELRDETGQLLWESKTVRSRGDCKELVKTAGVDIGVRLTPDPEPPPCPVCLRLPAPPVVEPRPEPSSAPPESGAPKGPLWMVGGGALVAFESPTVVAPGVSLLAGVRWPNVSLSLEPRVVFPGVGNRQGVRIDTTSLVGVVAACGHFGVFFGCGLAEGGATFLSGADAPVRALSIVGVGIRAGVEWKLSPRLVLRSHADAFGTLAPQTVSVGAPGVVAIWHAPDVVGVIGLVLAVLPPPSRAGANRVPSTPAP